MIQIFVEAISERLLYTLDFVFKERGLEYTLTNDHHTFIASEFKKINYSERYFENIIQLIPSTILFDEEIIIYDIHSGMYEKEDCLKIHGIIDPLGSIFFVLSRMEEYTSTLEDEHGRFQVRNSVLDRYHWLDKAMCDRWAVAFLNFLNQHELIVFQNQTHKVEIRPTFDIDNAYAYQLKTGWRKWLSTSKDILNRNSLRLKERDLVLDGSKTDPYDTYDYILSIANRGFKVNMFWLLGDYAKFDKNISYKNVRHQRLIRKMNLSTAVGIHPSYKSNSYEYHFLNEKERLELILHKTVENSRQHFLKLKLPVTYTTISSMGIKHDYTMGFAEKVGFRSGTARPHKWFDLSKNCISDLIIHPFVYMDGTLNEYLCISPEESKVVISKLFNEVKRFGGDFVFIWHNETIGNYGKWQGWQEVLEFTLNLKQTENE